MTREEKIEMLDAACADEVECSKCPIRIPDAQNPKVECKPWSECTEAEIDAAFAALAEARVWGLLPPTRSPDPVSKASHYQLPGGLECWDVMVAMFGPEQVRIWCKINAFKYLFRCDRKNGEEDIRKALANLQKYFELAGEAE